MSFVRLRMIFRYDKKIHFGAIFDNQLASEWIKQPCHRSVFQFISGRNRETGVTDQTIILPLGPRTSIKLYYLPYHTLLPIISPPNRPPIIPEPPSPDLLHFTYVLLLLLQYYKSAHSVWWWRIPKRMEKQRSPLDKEWNIVIWFIECVRLEFSYLCLLQDFLVVF